MAEAPKSSAPSKSAKANPVRDLAIALGIGLIVYLSTTTSFFSPEQVAGNIKTLLLSGTSVESFITQYLGPFEGIFIFVGIIFAAGVFWVTLRMYAVHHKEHELYVPIAVENTIAKEKMVQWQVVLDHVNSESPAEWKLAILEADNMLDEILEEQGYVGETVADKLKAMSNTRITSYDEVWEAHKVRNQIAHGGAIDMDLSKKLARDTVAKFGNAFRDLGYI